VIQEPLRDARDRFAELGSWDKASIHDVVAQVAEHHGINLGKLGQPIRVAVTGGPVSPPIDVTLALVGKERTLQRLDAALAIIAERASQQDPRPA
jgi:glutamyl-tRNA synthetase